MREKDLQSQIIQYLRSNGAYVCKVNIASKNGVPDLLVCWFGRFVGIEVKVGRNKPTALQEINLRRINQAGGWSLVARSLEDVKNFVQQIRGECG